VMIKAVFLDIAGVLSESRKPIPGALESVQRLQRRKVEVRFVTNTSQQSPRQVIEQLRGLGFAVEHEQLYTAPGAITAYLTSRRLKCYALVHPNLDELFRPFQAESPDAVVVADAGERFDFRHMNTAFQILMKGASLIAIGDNRYFRQQGKLTLDAGPFIHALGYAADKEPVIIGKPSREFFDIVLNSVPCAPDQALMIGDDVTADCEGALRAGLHACLVRTGKYQPGDESRCSLPGLRCEADVSEALRAYGF
jgi:HAD superfamily hydrolase (TIGR01458 family)